MYLNEKLYVEKEVKADPFTLEALIAWLETKNPEETYCYANNGECLIAQYLTYIGEVDVHVTSSYWWHGSDFMPKFLPCGWNSIALGPGEKRPTHSFGDALRRARELQKIRQRPHRA